MTGFLLYIIKSTVYLSVFYAFFMLVMRKTTFFRFNRGAFISGTIICMILPFINIRIPEGMAPVMPILESALNHEPAESMMLEGAVITLAFTVRSCLLMRKMMNAVRPMKYKEMDLRITDAAIPSFSWGRHIVISRKDLEDNPAILTHEEMHVRCGHSIDLLAYAIITTLHWFNPLVWIARTELKMLHEYEADDLTINQGIDATQYQLLLVKKAVGAKRFQLANGFNHSKLKNRITMMHKNKTNKWMRLAYILCVPALIGAMCCCSQNKAAEEEEAIPFELLYKGFTVHVSTGDGLLDATIKDFTISMLKDLISSARVSSDMALQVEYEPTVDQGMVESLKEAIQEISGDRNISTKSFEAVSIPFQLVEDKPTFQGGDANEFSRWVNTNLTYPDEAKDKDLQGRVTLSFTVDSDGKVKNVKVLRGVDPILDNEAKRVVESSPDWEPGKVDGKAVPVTYTFPVIFKLK